MILDQDISDSGILFLEGDKAGGPAACWSWLWGAEQGNLYAEAILYIDDDYRREDINQDQQDGNRKPKLRKNRENRSEILVLVDFSYDDPEEDGTYK